MLKMYSASVTWELRKIAQFLIFSAELTEDDIFNVIDNLSEIVNRKEMADPETMTLTRDGLDHLSNIRNFPIDKTKDNSIPKIMALFLKGLDTSAKQTPPNPEIQPLRDYLFERWGTPEKVMGIKTLKEVKRKIELAQTGMSAFYKR